jgi:enoyl-CoA hydratase/carnithine racemase
VTEPKVVVTEPAPRVALVTINRPEVLNAIDFDTQELLERALTDLSTSDDCGCVVLTGAGDRAFSAGFDVHEMGAMTAGQTAEMRQSRPTWADRINRMPIGIVAAINGVAYGAGALLALASDIRIGCSRSALRFSAVHYGGLMFTALLPSLIGRAKATEYLMTAREIGAEELLRSGLLNYVVDDQGLLPAALEMATTIADNPVDSVRALKEVLRTSEGLGYEERYEIEVRRQREVMGDRQPGDVFGGIIARRGGRHD